MDFSKEELEVKSVIVNHFGKLADTIEADFPKNYAKKKNNFLITGLSPEIRANMVFTSSWESKCGNAAEACAREFAQKRYEKENVPQLINPYGLSYTEQQWEKQTGQIVLSNINPHDSKLAGIITSFRAAHMGENALTQPALQELYNQTRGFVRTDGQVFFKPVDLGFYDKKRWNLMEIKAGGDLDTTKAPAEVDKLLMLYVLLGQPDTQIRFATLYNKDGEGNNWKGTITKYLTPELLWIGKSFWEMMVPYNITFSKFESLYNAALIELDLPTRIEALIETTINA